MIVLCFVCITAGKKDRRKSYSWIHWKRAAQWFKKNSWKAFADNFGLLPLHTLLGCDKVPTMSVTGKLTALKVLNSFFFKDIRQPELWRKGKICLHLLWYKRRYWYVRDKVSIITTNQFRSVIIRYHSFANEVSVA